MSGSRTSSPFTGRTASGLWDAMEQFRGRFEQRVGARMGRGDLRSAVLASLSEEPMHGYQVIRSIEERSQGSWTPTPGAVYPLLQLLADEGLVTAKDTAGKKTYTLTDTGHAEVEAAKAAAAESAGSGMPGMPDMPAMRAAAAKAGKLPKAGALLAQAAAQVAQSGSTQQIDEAVALLDEARRKLYAILARD